jgi:hypothetical protein
MKYVALHKVLPQSAIRKAAVIYRQHQGHYDLHERLVRDVVLPNMGRINRATDQENDPDYWGYALEYALGSKEEN